MARLKNVAYFSGDYYNPEHYDSEDKEELKDNILFLLDELENQNNSKTETIGYLKDIMKNYYANVILAFLDN